VEVFGIPLMAVGPLAALVVVLLWPRLSRIKLSKARASLVAATQKASELRALGLARVRHATKQHKDQETAAAQVTQRRVEAVRESNRATWRDREPTVNAALDIVNIVLAQHGSLSLERSKLVNGPGPEYGLKCSIIAHDRPNGYVGSLLLMIDRDHFICTLQWPGFHSNPIVRDVAAGMGAANIADLIVEALRPVAAAAATMGAPRPRVQQQGFAQRRFA
jgi:hypothetical protein